MEHKDDIYIGIIIMLIAISFGQCVKSCHHKTIEPEIIVQKQQDSIVTLNNKIDSLKVEFIKDSYEAKLLSDSDAVELFYELLRH